MSHDLFELGRAVRDCQSQISRLTSRLGQPAGPSPAALLARTLAVQLLARCAGDPDPLAFAQRLFQTPIEKLPRTFARALFHGAGEVFKTAVSPAATTVAGWASELTQTVNYTGVLPAIAPASTYAALAARGGPRVILEGNAIGVKFPSRTPGSMAGSFYVEGAAIRVAKATFVTATLAPKKLALISELTEEISLYSAPTIASIIETAIREDTTSTLDSLLLDTTASSTSRPAGLLNGVTPTLPTTGGGLAALAADLGNLAAAIASPSDLVFLVNPADIVRGAALLGGGAVGGGVFAAILAPQLTPKRIVALDAADFCSIENDSPRFVISTEATLHEDDTTPLAIGTAGAPNTVAAPTRSLFQSDTAAIRMSLFCAWMMRRPGRVAYVDAVTW